MPRTITVRAASAEEVVELRDRLSDPRPALTAIGALVVAQARRAFEEQRLGDVVWPERSPKQSEPFLNIPPVVANATEGRAPRADDFRRRPALGGVGSRLAQSIAANVGGDAVEVGTSAPGAAQSQYGGPGTIRITDTTRAVLAKWLGVSGTSATAASRPKTIGRGQDGKPVKTAGTGLQYARKLAFVFDPDRSEMRAWAYPRPFIGFTPQTLAGCEDEIADMLGAEAI